MRSVTMEIREPGDQDWMPVARVQILQEPGGLDAAYRILRAMRERWQAAGYIRQDAEFRYFLQGNGWSTQ